MLVSRLVMQRMRAGAGMSEVDLKQFFLERVRLFEHFPADKVDEIVAGTQLATFEGNEAILETGDEGRFIGVVISGLAEISVSDNTGTRSVISQLGEGDVFGVMSLLTGERIAADRRAHRRGCHRRHPLFRALDSGRGLSRIHPDQAQGRRVSVAPARGTDPRDVGRPGRCATQQARAFGRPLRTVARQHGARQGRRPERRQIHFGIYDTRDLGSDIHGVIDNADPDVARVSVSVGPHARSLRSLERPAFALRDLFAVIQESTRLLGEAFELHLHDITAVGHRVVHGGSKFASAVVITPTVIADIEALAIFAPLHNPINVEGIRLAIQRLPDVPHVAVFDTAFHQTLPPYAYLYGLPYDLYKRDGVRRYGFHGTSHRYVSLKAAEVLKRPLGELEIVSCHLGIGASLCAIDHGRSVDTTMGMTPTDGLIMPTA